jgi:membrane dipeptidase
MRVALAAVCIAGLSSACALLPPPTPGEEPAQRLHREAIIVDTHSDTTPWFEDPDWQFGERHAEGHMDLPRIREGGLDVQFWSIYMGPIPGRGGAIREAIERIDAVYRMAERYPEWTEVATSVADIRRIVADGRLASLMGIEGGHIIEQSLAALRTFQRLGVRYLTLTHSFNTSWADSSGTTSVPEPTHHGLAPFGEDVVRELNRLGMMVDVSHVSDETFWDVIRVTRAPVIASHSSCRALAQHVRNLSDEMLRALARNGGVIMLNFYPAYIDEQAGAATREHSGRLRARLELLKERYRDDPVGLRRARRRLVLEHPFPKAPLDRLLDHFDHAIRVAGPDHVGIGADWDGVPSMPEGMEDVARLPDLTRGLLERGHSPETVVKVLGENLLRVMAEVERGAAELRAEERPGPR